MPNVALYRSEDGGKTISIVQGASGRRRLPPNLDRSCKDSSRMILGTDQGATISLDYGQTWSTWYNQPTGQFLSRDHGRSVSLHGLRHAAGQWQRGGFAAVATPGRSRLATGFPPAVQRADTWRPIRRIRTFCTPAGPTETSLSSRYSHFIQLQDITPWPVSTFGSDINARKYRDPWTPVLLMSPFDKKTLYLGTQYVMKTLDGGLHWETISPDLTGETQHPGDKKPGRPGPRYENAKERG